MDIDKLKRLMPPPKEPVYPGTDKEWRAFQATTGLKFPNDYFIVANTYGSGRFLAGEFKVANPFDPDDTEFAEFELTRLREAKNSAPAAVPYPLFPEDGGLYPFGIDGNGNTFLWVTDGNPSRWAIVCFNSEDYSEVVKHTLIEFLVLLASNKLEINRRKFWGSDFAQDLLAFTPRRVHRSPRRKSSR